MSRKIKFIVPLVLVIIWLLWAGMAFIDYKLSVNGRTPIFACNTLLSAENLIEYRGIGYSVLIDIGIRGDRRNVVFLWGWNSFVPDSPPPLSQSPPPIEPTT